MLPAPLGVTQTTALFGGLRLPQGATDDVLGVHDLLEQGLPHGAFEHLLIKVPLLRSAGLERAVGISLRTWQRRKDSPEQRLSPEQSGRVWIFAEILSRATSILGSQPEAEAWLERPCLALDQRKPLDLLSTPAGVQSVQDHLTRLEYGVYT